MYRRRKSSETQKKVFGEMIRDARKSYGLTQEEFAEIVGCSSHWINKIERGKSDPNWVDALCFAAMLGLDPGNIMERVGIDVPILTN